MAGQNPICGARGMDAAAAAGDGEAEVADAADEGLIQLAGPRDCQGALSEIKEGGMPCSPPPVVVEGSSRRGCGD